jgi:hypothetical protein
MFLNFHHGDLKELLIVIHFKLSGLYNKLKFKKIDNKIDQGDKTIMACCVFHKYC